MQPAKVLIIATSHTLINGTTRKTGLWLEEAAVPYYIFKDAGMLVTLASPKGGAVITDPKSESIIVSNSTIKRFQKDPVAQSWLSNSLISDKQNADDFDIVLLIGGHGALWDFAENLSLKSLLENFINQQKLIGAVSQGVTALLNLQTISEELFIKGKKITAISNTEEQSSGLTDFIPFLLESKLLSLGALYSKSANFISHIVVDENIITGQNPSSAKDVAHKLLARYKEISNKLELAVH